MNVTLDIRGLVSRIGRYPRFKMALVLATVSLAAIACSAATVSPAAQPGGNSPTAAEPSQSPRVETDSEGASGSSSEIAADSSVAPDSSPPSNGGDPVAAVFRELNPTGPKDFSPSDYRQLLPRDAISPIYEPTIGPPEEADLDPRELVIGVTIGEESRAYPIRALRFREMVNDELGGVPILVTW